MRHPDQRVLGPVVLVVVALLATLAFATGTVTVTRSVFTWAADRVGQPASLVLSAQSPQTLTLEGPCAAAGSPDPSDLLITGPPDQDALTVRAQDAKVWMTFGGMQIGDVLDAAGDCRVSLTYQRSDNAAVLQAGALSTSGVVAAPAAGIEAPVYRQFAVSRLWAAPGFAATVTTQPTTYSSSAWRLLWVMVVAGCLAALFRILRRPGDPSPPLPRTARWTAADTVVAVTAALSLVVVPPRFDDGWVLTTIRHYDELGFFSNYYSLDAAPQPQGFWWGWLERLWLEQTALPGFLLRLPSMLIVVATWWLLRRHVLDRLDLSRSAMWSSVCVACAGLVALQVTLRPEPLIALLLTAAVAVVLHYARSGQPQLLVLLGLLSALALSAHQTGWTVVAASASVLPWVWSRSGHWRALAVPACVAVVSACLAVVLAMLGSNARLWWTSVRAFGRDSATYQSALDEGDRIGLVATRLDNPAVTVVYVAVIMLAVVGFILRRDGADLEARAAGWAAVAALGGLLLTASKLVDHYAAVVPAVALLTALAVRGLRRTVAVGAVAGLAVAAFVALRGTRTWALALERVTVPQSGWWAAPAVVVVVAALVAGLVLLARGRPPAPIVTGVLATTVAAAVVVSVLPLVADVRIPASWLGQQLAALRGRTCGVVDASTMRSVPASLFEASTGGTGRRQVPVPSNGSAWAKGPLFSPVVVQTVAEDGQVTRQTLPPSGDVWAEIPVTPQDRAVTWTQSAVDVVAAVGQPQPAADVVAADPGVWWVEPSVGLQVPCLTSVSIADGTVDAARYSVGRPTGPAQRLTLNAAVAYEAGCAGSSGGVRGTCLVDVNPAAPAMVGGVIEERIG